MGAVNLKKSASKYDAVCAQYFCTSLHKNISAFFLIVFVCEFVSRWFRSFSIWLFCFGYLSSKWYAFIITTRNEILFPIHNVQTNHRFVAIFRQNVLFAIHNLQLVKSKLHYLLPKSQSKNENQNKCEMFLNVWIFQKGFDSKKSTFLTRNSILHFCFIFTVEIFSEMRCIKKWKIPSNETK